MFFIFLFLIGLWTLFDSSTTLGVKILQ